MKREHFLTALFFTVAAITFYLFYSIIIPFFVPICWAMVFAILFYPLYERLVPRVRRRGLASLIVCVLIVVLIIGPIGYLFVALVNEAVAAVGVVNQKIRSGELENILNINIPFLNTLKDKLGQYFDLSSVDMNNLAKDAVSRVSGAVVSQTTWLLTNFSRAVFYFAIMVFTMFYFFTDGAKLVSRLKRLMPLTDEQIELTFDKLRDVIQATMYGTMVIAFLQGLLGGILFASVGISSPVFWGAVMTFLSIIPVVGAFVVYVPAGLILIVSGSFVKGIIVVLIGTLVISQVDNVVRPFLISGKAAMHPLLLFLSILGGIAMFGLLGVVLGPMIGALFLTLIDCFELSLHPKGTEIPEEPAPPEEN